jgi:hypothetical protein
MTRDRRDMTSRVLPLGSREAGLPPCPPGVVERLALVTRLSREAWELSRRPTPSYTRATIPVALRSLRDPGTG